MIGWMAGFLERRLRLPPEQTTHALYMVGAALAATAFVLTSTIIVAFDSVFSNQTVATLEIGDIAPRDIHAPQDVIFPSEELTQQRREITINAVRPVYDPPDPAVARQQTQLARQILDFIENVRRDPYATLDQKIDDSNQVSALSLDPIHIEHVLEMGEEAWRAVDEQISSVLERVMRDDIRESDLAAVRDQLPTQVSVRFNTDELAAIVAIVEDLVRPNTFENPEETAAAQRSAGESVPQQTVSFERGQIVVRAGERIDAVDIEALHELGLLQPADRRMQEIGSALLVSVLVVVVAGLYIGRFKPALFDNPPLLTLLAAIFLMVMIGLRLFGDGQQVYLYPTSVLALIVVVVAGPEVAVVGVITLAMVVGMMANNSFEIAMMTTMGGITGLLTLRRSERLNNSFFAGLVISLTNTLVITAFNLEMLTGSGSPELSALILFGLLNGVLAAAAAITSIYLITQLFNLPTSLKLLELSQPSQKLLQRLLREAPGTYQHSLQVANLSEQAANEIGANADLVRVAALYHDIGKMLDPAFFVENQSDVGNPHDVLNDPYRSADIIIGHVIEGDRLARKERLPNRIRDFIREHHGTSVLYFYQQAIAQADGDESAVDIEQFQYPGPKPRSRETAIMMLADSCEATVRARRPTSRQEITDIVEQIIETKRRDGQLDESNLTLNDLNAVRTIFIDMLQAVFHPRINYPAAAPDNRRAEPSGAKATVAPVKAEPFVGRAQAAGRADGSEQTTPGESAAEARQALPDTPTLVDDEDEPLPDVPPLPRARETRSGQNHQNGTRTTREARAAHPEETETDSG